MAKKHKPEEIVVKLRQVDVLVSQGTPIVDAIRSIGVTEVTYYRWRNEYGGLKSDQVSRTTRGGPIKLNPRPRITNARVACEPTPKARFSAANQDGCEPTI